MKLLYVGRLTPEKGVHTAISALALLNRRGDQLMTLDIVGGGDADYERELKALVERHGLEGRVTLRGRVPRSEMQAVFAEYDGLIFPSKWDEPFARTVLEALAAGLVVIGTTTGGTGEVLLEGETGLTFPPGDAEALAGQIRRLLDDPLMRPRLSAAGRQRVLAGFTFPRMVDQIEAALMDLVPSARS